MLRKTIYIDKVYLVFLYSDTSLNLFNRKIFSCTVLVTVCYGKSVLSMGVSILLKKFQRYSNIISKVPDVFIQIWCIMVTALHVCKWPLDKIIYKHSLVHFYLNFVLNIHVNLDTSNDNGPQIIVFSSEVKGPQIIVFSSEVKQLRGKTAEKWELIVLNSLAIIKTKTLSFIYFVFTLKYV